MINSFSINRDDIENRLTGSFLAVGTAKLVHPCLKKAINKTLFHLDNKMEPPASDVLILHQNLDEAVKLTGMDKYGVNVQYLKEPAKLKPHTKCNDIVELVENGHNCSFLPIGYKSYPKNTILMPEKKRAFSGLHELGHAICHHSKIGNLVSKADTYVRKYRRGVLKWAVIWGAFSEKSEPTKNRELSPIEKANNFVRDNAGKLTVGFAAPMILNEFLASYNAQKIANKHLNKNLSRKMLKSNTIGMASYVLHTLAYGAVAASAVAIKDKCMDITKNKEKPQNI